MGRRHFALIHHTRPPPRQTVKLTCEVRPLSTQINRDASCVRSRQLPDATKPGELRSLVYMRESKRLNLSPAGHLKTCVLGTSATSARPPSSSAVASWPKQGCAF